MQQPASAVGQQSGTSRNKRALDREAVQGAACEGVTGGVSKVSSPLNSEYGSAFGAAIPLTQNFSLPLASKIFLVRGCLNLSTLVRFVLTEIAERLIK
jgi:hypothetical protein